MSPFKELSEYADKYPYTCPCCGRDSRRREKNRCKRCGKPIEIYSFGRGKIKHRLYVHRAGKCGEIVKHVLHLIRITRGDRLYDFTNEKLQLGLARVLLNKCGGEADIAYHLVEAFFDPDTRRKENIWVTVTNVGSLVSITGCFDQALAYARRQARVERARPVHQARLQLDQAC